MMVVLYGVVGSLSVCVVSLVSSHSPKICRLWIRLIGHSELTSVSVNVFLSKRGSVMDWSTVLSVPCL